MTKKGMPDIGVLNNHTGLGTSGKVNKKLRELHVSSLPSILIQKNSPALPSLTAISANGFGSIAENFLPRVHTIAQPDVRLTSSVIIFAPSLQPISLWL